MPTSRPGPSGISPAPSAPLLAEFYAPKTFPILVLFPPLFPPHTVPLASFKRLPDFSLRQPDARPVSSPHTAAPPTFLVSFKVTICGLKTLCKWATT